MDLRNFMRVFALACILVLYSSCSEDDATAEAENLIIDDLSQGPGLFEFNYSSTGLNKTLRVYYYIPENKTTSSPILFVFHGAGRNAKDYRDAMRNKADDYGVIVMAPEFSIQNFPSGDQYNLGNVFVDGDNPSPTTLNPENEWSFSIIEPLFDFVKTQINNSNSTYDLFGHSAGAQFAHRLLMFKPNARINNTVVSASGWYTFPNTGVVFPYGLEDSPLENLSLDVLFSKNVYIQVGENDNNPNDSGLRHNAMADAQGTNRKDRAVNFYQFSQQLALDNAWGFNWSFDIIENADHNYVLATQNAADLLYN